MAPAALYSATPLLSSTAIPVPILATVGWRPRPPAVDNHRTRSFLGRRSCLQANKIDNHANGCPGYPVGGQLVLSRKKGGTPFKPNLWSHPACLVGSWRSKSVHRFQSAKLVPYFSLCWQRSSRFPGQNGALAKSRRRSRGSSKRALRRLSRRLR
jgi:hypothetical protein